MSKSFWCVSLSHLVLCTICTWCLRILDCYLWSADDVLLFWSFFFSHIHNILIFCIFCTLHFLYLILGDIADKRFCLLRSMLLFCGLSVTFVHCAQMAEDIDADFLCIQQPHIFHIASKFHLHWSTSLSLNFAPKWRTQPLLIWLKTFDGKLRPND